VRIIEKGYNNQVIALLEETLTRAKSGEILQLLLVFESDGRNNKDKKHDFETCYTGCDNVAELVGHIEQLKRRMLKRMDI
jgi:hypothetical protein